MTRMGDTDAESLGSSTCWELLRTVDVGRLAVLVDGAPDIFPVNFVVDHGSVVFRTAPGTKLDAALRDAPVAFEVDGIDADERAWSVVLRGVAAERRGLDEALETVSLPLFPWHGDAKPRFLRITPATLSGRRFPIADRSRWITALTQRHD
jgi:nitroimidazol reductase NimA-like FMN-containing flavoprotein (pyridoxamine 5'-phosphate oxidase superfamily)